MVRTVEQGGKQMESPERAAMKRWRAVRGDLLTALPGGRVRLVRGGLLVYDGAGRIRHAGRATKRFAGVELTGGSARALVAAAFWDPHVHLPQLSIAGRYHEPLLEWLERRVFPVEATHRDDGRARVATRAFFDALSRGGTAGAGVFTAPFSQAARLALEEGARRGIPLRCGPPLMDRGDAGLTQPLHRWRKAIRCLDEAFGPVAAIVPRYALSCGDGLLEEAGAWARARRRWVLTHLAENRSEVAAVEQRFPGLRYAEVYDRFRLLGPRTLLAHGVWLTGGELALLRRRRSWLVHCPSSNLALGSGRMPLERVRGAGVRWCLASDVGAGPDLCLLDVMRAALEVHHRLARLTACEAYYRATLAGAEALGFGRTRGALLPGRSADFLLVEEGFPRLRSAESVIRHWLERGRSARWSETVGMLHVGGRSAGRDMPREADG